MIISFGGSKLEQIRIEVLGYQQEPSGEYYDDNWLSVKVSIIARGFRGKAYASFFTSDFASFLPQIKSLYEVLHGSAEFHTIEEQLHLKLTGDGKGHITMEGNFRDQPADANQLNFSFGFDQAQLKESINQLEQVVSAFPIRTA